MTDANGNSTKRNEQRKVTKLLLNKETLHDLTGRNGEVRNMAHTVNSCVATCIVTGRPCPPPCY